MPTGAHDFKYFSEGAGGMFELKAVVITERTQKLRSYLHLRNPVPLTDVYHVMVFTDLRWKAVGECDVFMTCQTTSNVKVLSVILPPFLKTTDALT